MAKLQRETFGSLLGVLKLSLQRMFSNIPMLLFYLISIPVITVITIAIFFIVPFDYEYSSAPMITTFASELGFTAISNLIYSTFYLLICCVVGSEVGFKKNLTKFFSLCKSKLVILTAFLFALGICTSLGILLLIIPGIYILMRTYLTPFILIHEDVSVGEALDKGADLMKGNKFITFVFLMLSYIGIVAIYYILNNIGLYHLHQITLDIGMIGAIIDLGYVFLEIMLLFILLSLVMFAFPCVLYFKRNKLLTENSTGKIAATTLPEANFAI